jgi:hypothetical protein
MAITVQMDNTVLKRSLSTQVAEYKKAVDDIVIEFRSLKECAESMD